MKIDGRALAGEIAEDISARAKGQHKKMCIVQVGDDPATASFIKTKSAAAQRIGVEVDIVSLPSSTPQDELTHTIKSAGDCNGIVVQLPLPATYDTEEVLSHIPPALDIDALRPDALTAYETGTTNRVPPVVFAIATVLERFAVDYKSKHIVILGKGKLVGTPMMAYCRKNGISFEAFDKNDDQEIMKEKMKTADIIVSGIGVPGFVTDDLIKDGALLIDAGTSEQFGKLTGDIDPSCYAKASLYTPVPGGIGPLTVVGLFNNLFL